MLFLRPSIFFMFVLFLISPLHMVIIEKVMGASPLSERSLRAIMDKMDEAVQERDPGGMVRFMTPGILIEVIVKSEQGTSELSMTRDQYRQHLAKAFLAIDEYSFSRTILNIHIESDHLHATVISHISEKITLRGMTLLSETREIAKFTVIDGQILISSLEAFSKVEQNQLFEL